MAAPSQRCLNLVRNPISQPTLLTTILFATLGRLDQERYVIECFIAMLFLSYKKKPVVKSHMVIVSTEVIWTSLF